MKKWTSRAWSVLASALANLRDLYFFFFHPRIFASHLKRCLTITNGLKFALTIVVLTFVMEAISERLFNHAGFDSFTDFVSCDSQIVVELKRRPEIQQWLEDRELITKNNQHPSPEYLGMKMVGSAFPTPLGEPGDQEEGGITLEFGLSTKIGFPQYCIVGADAPQLALVKFGLASILFDKVIPQDIYNEPVAAIFLVTISALFSISAWYVLIRLGAQISLKSAFLISLYSVAIWHGLIYIPLALTGLYYSFDESLPLHFDLFQHLFVFFLYAFSSATLVLGYLFAYFRMVSQASFWKVAVGLFIGAGAACLLVPLIMVPILYIILNFGYWIGLLVGG